MTPNRNIAREFGGRSHLLRTPGFLLTLGKASRGPRANAPFSCQRMPDTPLPLRSAAVTDLR